MHFNTFVAAFLSLASFSTALPAVDRGRQRTPTNWLSELTLPLSTTSGVALPAPSPTYTLKAVAFGRGTQNYTCKTSDATTVPVAIGAKASLFDASVLLPFIPARAAAMVLNVFPTYLVSMPVGAVALLGLPQIGVHYFNALGQPTFDLTQGGKGFITAAKVGDIAAPATACKGALGVGNGAVDWLSLTARTDVPIPNLKEVYRVETAGGKQPATCAGMPAEFNIQYSAQYWFYQ